MGLLLSKLHVMSCLCPTVQQQQHCALLHESPQTAQRSWFMSSFLFFSFLFSFFLFSFHLSRFHVSFGVARSCMTINK